MKNRPESADTPHDLELLLKQFQPKSNSKTDVEVVYQCGWAAALESQLSTPGSLQSTRYRSSPLTPFVSGLVSGLAAAVLLMAALRTPESPQQPMADSASRNPDAMQVTSEQKLAIGMEQAERPTRSTSSKNRPSLFDGMLALSKPINADVSSAIVGGQSTGSSLVLSPAARNSWASSLMTPESDRASSGAPQALQFEAPSLPTLGEMLFEVDDYL